jgi:aminomethyltransferase
MALLPDAFLVVFLLLSSNFYLLYSTVVMPIGTPLHDRTFPLCTSLNYRDWAGYYAVSAYETHHEHEYNAIRNGAALIDISPLFKYILRGRDAAR